MSPITVLSGFLGSGKTTLLRHLLSNDAGWRVGVVVNDVASINIDASLVQRTVATDTVSVVELQNGCMCCTASADLLLSIAEVVRLAQDRGYTHDHIVVEATGVADPTTVRDRFVRAREAGHGLFQWVYLDTMVTVVDVCMLPALLAMDGPVSAHAELLDPDLVAAEPQAGGEGSARGDMDPTARMVVDLCVSQIECADVVVLNKMDLIGLGAGPAFSPPAGAWGDVGPVGGLTAEGAAQMARALNPTADIVPTSFCRVPIDRIFASARPARDGDTMERCHSCAVPSSAAGAAGAAGAAQGAALQVKSFIYRRQRPFHHQRLTAALSQHIARNGVAIGPHWLDAWPHGPHAGAGTNPGTGTPARGLLRSKGFAWLHDDHVQAYEWQHTGGRAQVLPSGLWTSMAQVRAEARSDALAGPKGATATDLGGRRQELAFIGTADMDEGALTTLLDTCILTEEEYLQYLSTFVGGDNQQTPIAVPEAETQSQAAHSAQR